MTDQKARPARDTAEKDSDFAELFRWIGDGNSAGVGEMLRFRPELSRCRNGAGLSVLEFARYMQQDAILTLLIDAGPPLDIFEASQLDCESQLAAMIEREPGVVRSHDPSGGTPLHVAVASGSTRCIPLLVNAGASVEARTLDHLAQTPLHAAVEQLQADAVRTLLRHGADPNAPRNNGETALMIAAAANHRTIAELLIAYNANVDVRDSEGRTAAGCAESRGHLALAARLTLGERVVDHRAR